MELKIISSFSSYILFSFPALTKVKCKINNGLLLIHCTQFQIVYYHNNNMGSFF